MTVTPDPVRQRLEISLATTLAPILFAVATFAAGAVNIIKDINPLIDVVLSALAILCVFSVSLLVDFVIDGEQLNWRERCTFLGYGYLCFCIVVGAVSAMIPAILDIKFYPKHNAHNINELLNLPIYFMFFVVFGISVFVRMMTKEDYNLALLYMLVFLGLSIWGLFWPIPGWLPNRS